MMCFFSCTQEVHKPCLKILEDLEDTLIPLPVWLKVSSSPFITLNF